MAYQHKDKNHYFIGNIFKDENQIKLLRNIQKKLKKKYYLKNIHYNNKLFTNLIYLGYLDKFTAELYMEDIIKYLLKAIEDNFSVLKCNYSGYSLKFDKTFYKISLKFNDEENLLEKIIVPYLHKNAILPVYTSKKDILKPMIDLIYFKESRSLVDGKMKINIQVPNQPFQIDELSLIKGSSIHDRKGTPSLHNQMVLEEVNKYSIKLKE